MCCVSVAVCNDLRLEWWLRLIQFEALMDTKQANKEAAINRRFLRAPGAANYLGLSTSTLAKMRLRGDGPPYSKSGRRVVVYNLADLDAYLAVRRRHSTSETSA